MKHVLLGLLTALIAMGTAAADITDAQIQRLIEARGLSIGMQDDDNYYVMTPDGERLIIGTVDHANQGRRTILAFFAVFQNSSGRSAAQMNDWNVNSLTKGIVLGGNAGISHMTVAISELSDEALLSAWDLFVADVKGFRVFLYGNALINSASLGGLGPNPRLVNDGGLSHAEIVSRDAALAASLNRAGGAEPATVGKSFRQLQEEAFGPNGNWVSTDKR